MCFQILTFFYFFFFLFTISGEEKKAAPLAHSLRVVGEYNEMKIDSYAFGIILFQMWSRREPYVGQNPFVVMTSVLLHDLRPNHSPLEFPSKWYRLMVSCWDRDPKVRPSFVDIVDRLSEMKSKSMVNFKS